MLSFGFRGESIDAEDLEVGEEILSLDGDYGIVEKVVVVEDANQPMYNLTVDEAHTFFIGDGDWLVHNTEPCGVDPDDIDSLNEWFDNLTHGNHPPGASSTNNNQYWNRTVEGPNGQTVYVRDDLIDPNLVDAQGRTNLERMRAGYAPIGPDGESIELHHLIQTETSSLAEVEATFHDKYDGVLHIYPGGRKPSDLELLNDMGLEPRLTDVQLRWGEREYWDWDRTRRTYWKSRARDFE